ncbi:hypothetical protein [Pacificibacter marinus]|uniref:hypothetical protein n=1 Tax=Pacificibacter marinus TaxID=658057 RepID=UPI002091A369|nr:hypothetical protein [Pacificibacter marinus]
MQLDTPCMKVTDPEHPTPIMLQSGAGEGFEILHELALLCFGRGILGSKAQHAGLILPAMWNRVHEIDHALRMTLQNLRHDRTAGAFDLVRSIPFGLTVLVVVHDDLVNEVVHGWRGFALTMVEELDHHRQLQCLCANLPRFRSMPTNRLKIASRSR